ncbi:hypothetical protein [Actinacidiphila oryziradicis]|jgi:2-methylcitrate dehydratase PrpD|uniref:hypothetical protein n=1 Tax=Actinacidiphila oryziradicis TaxID=2571141 RepID=UPI0023EF6692|nr:hypothetical protein [Actinacidiphila oryziradicis]MCW2873658.1 2-methylcitrate dehydratase [Actinacidiphila oryziradicis]
MTEKPEKTLSARLADWTTALECEQVPPRAVEMAKLLILDQLGLQLRGAGLPHLQPVRELVGRMKAVPGRRRPPTSWASPGGRRSKP